MGTTLNQSVNQTVIPRVRGFKMASLNIVSLPLHIDQIRILLEDQIIDVLALNETRLDPSIPDHLVAVDGYTILRKDRNRFGGGVCIYLRCNLNFKRRHTLCGDQYEIIILI